MTGSPGQETAARRERLAALRRTYSRSSLSEADVAPDPFVQFQRWFDEAVEAGLTEPNAMVLATASADGEPSARTVLLKGVDHGFVVFTNFGSRKGRDLLANPRASLVFPWFELDRQVVVLGTVEQVDGASTEAYFRSRPHDSKLGAWASEQSSVIAGRRELDARFADLEQRWPLGTDVPLPPGWGGFRVVPVSVEFWQGRTSRLHDRLRHVRTSPAPGQGGEWRVERLSP